jgi:hypothetical protein
MAQAMGDGSEKLFVVAEEVYAEEIKSAVIKQKPQNNN